MSTAISFHPCDPRASSTGRGMDPKNLPRITPKTKNTQNQTTTQEIFRWDKVPYSAPIYLRVSKKLLRKLKEIDPSIKDDFDTFIIDTASGLIWIEGYSKPLTYIESFKILKTYFTYINHVKPFR